MSKKIKKPSMRPPEAWLTQRLVSVAKRLLEEKHPAHPDWIDEVKRLLTEITKDKPAISEMQLKFIKLASQETAQARAHANNCEYHFADRCLCRRDVWLNAALILDDNQH